jgi:protoporphyrinogen IX oxidase
MAGMTYLWLKALHVIFVIFWMAGLFMLPRLFVYHQETPPEAPENALWTLREARLLRIILWPAMALSWLFGAALAISVAAYVEGWFLAKLAMVAGLSGYQLWLAGYHRALARGERRLGGRQLRLLNEVPGLAAIGIVILVIVRPF